MFRSTLRVPRPMRLVCTSRPQPSPSRRAPAVVLVARTLLDPSPWWLVGALGASLFLFVAALAYPGGMGMGDVKLALLLGAGVGSTVPVALFAGMLLALLPSAVLFARYGK